MKHAIEESFPIVEINKQEIIENNWFKGQRLLTLDRNIIALFTTFF